MIRILLKILIINAILNAYVVGVPKKLSNIPIDSLPQDLWEKGYWHARVDSIHCDTAFVTLGKPAILNSVKFVCPDSVKDFLKKINPPKTSKILHINEIICLESEIVNELKNNGYPFASCSTALAKIDETDSAILVDLDIIINPGIQVILKYLDSRIEGRTKKEVLKHLMLFRPGMKYSQKHIDRGTQRLRRAGIIALSMPPYPAIDQNGDFALVVRGKDIAANSFQGMLGTNGKDVSGEIQFISKNLFGTGRKVNLLASHRKKQATFFFFFMEPFIGNLNISPQVNVNIEIANYIRQNYALGFEFPLTFELSGYAGVKMGRNYDKQNPHGGTKLFGGEFSANMSTIDDPIFPKHGFIVRAGITATKLEDIDEGKTRLAISAKTNQLFVKTYKNFSLWVRANIKGYLSPRFPDKSCWYPLGGWRNLRGFRENQFYGSKVGVISFEPRIFIGSTWAALLFFDFGAYLDFSGWHKPKSYGAGVEYKNPPAAISIIYGISEGRALDEGLVHIGMRLEM